jgi:hypothetical protein
MQEVPESCVPGTQALHSLEVGPLQMVHVEWQVRQAELER